MKVIIFFLFCVSSIWAIPLNRNFTAISTRGGRLVGGTPATAGQFPFVASIIETTSDGKFFCSGSLISNVAILTAGTCVNGAIEFEIGLGTHYRIGVPGQQVTTVATGESALHPDFSLEPLSSDLGFILLREPVSYTQWLHPMLLPDSDLYNGEDVTAVGWGTTSDATDDFEDLLQHVSLTTLTNSECRAYYGDQIEEHMVCIIGEYNEGTCNGDMGSPLVHIERLAAEVLVGVASFISAGGCESPYPSGYTRVYPFLDWILVETGATPPKKLI